MNNLNFTLGTKNEEQKKPHCKQKKQIIKTRAEINQMETNTIEKIKSWFFVQMNKINKPLARLMKE